MNLVKEMSGGIEKVVSKFTNVMEFEDAFQLCFLKCWESLHKYDLERGNLESFSYVVANSTMLNVYVKKKRREKYLMDDFVVWDEITVQDELEYEELCSIIRKKLTGIHLAIFDISVSNTKEFVDVVGNSNINSKNIAKFFGIDRKRARKLLNEVRRVVKEEVKRYAI